MSNVLIAACTLLLTTVAGAAEIRGIVVDISGTPVIDATVVRVVGGREEPVTLASDGTFTVPAEEGEIRVRAAGFAEAVVPFTLESTELIRVVLQPASFADSIVVTADRGTSRLPSAASATVLTSAELNNAASGALDDVLRQTPGFTLFRRSTSRTANPTTQGVTLRGVSGSGASRTLVLADGVPLNDPFGSWVYWNRVPLAAIDRVEVVRGGAGDLYGADALGGVIQVLTFSPTRPRLRAAVDGGSHSTGRGSLFGGTRLGGWTATAAGEVVKTAGVITLDRAVAGPVDVKADSDYRTGFFSVGTSRERWRASVRLSGYAEDRNNGTPVQVNTTDWRQLSAEAGGLAADGAWEAHLASGSQDYYQTFSAVAGDRRTERLTTFQTIPSDFVSVAGQWSRFFGRHSLLLGADTRHTESTIDEYRFTLVSGVNTPSGPFVSGGTERSSAVFGRFAYAAGDRLSLAVGLRGDFWKSEPVQQTLPTQSVSFFSPRFGVSYRVGDDVMVQGAVYRAHRTPTLNELHRGFRVGIIQTNPNVLLEPETLTGFESGFLYTRNRLSLRATGVRQQPRRRGRERHAHHHADADHPHPRELGRDSRPRPRDRRRLAAASRRDDQRADDLHLQPLPRIDRDARPRRQPRAASAWHPVQRRRDLVEPLRHRGRPGARQRNAVRRRPEHAGIPVAKIRDRRSLALAAGRSLRSGILLGREPLRRGLRHRPHAAPHRRVSPHVPRRRPAGLPLIDQGTHDRSVAHWSR